MRDVRRYQLVGLKTINDAEKIESALREVSQLEQVHVDFINCTLSIANKKVPKSLWERIKTIVRMVDPHIHVQKQNKYGWVLSTGFFLMILLFCLLSVLFRSPMYLSTGFFLIGMILGLVFLFYPQENFFSNYMFFLERMLIIIGVVLICFFGQPFLGMLTLIVFDIKNLIEILMRSYLNHCISVDTIESFRFANIKQDNHIVRVPVKDVKVDDVVYVKPGERIPVDGIIIDGKSRLDYSLLSLKQKIVVSHLHMEVYGGMVNLSGVIAVQVTKDFAHSKWVQMLEFLRDADTTSTKLEKRMKKILIRYDVLLGIIIGCVFCTSLFFPQEKVFFLFLCALFLLFDTERIGEYILLYWKYGWKKLYHLGIFTRGIAPLEMLSRVKCVVFDLEHTLTYGKDMVAKIVNHTRYTDEELLFYAACAEEYSISPVAMAIKHRYGKRVDTSLLHGYQELSGLGVKVEIEKQTILVGNEGLLTKYGVWVEAPKEEVGTVLHVAIDKEYAGYFVIRDELKPDMDQWLHQCRKRGIRHIKVVSHESDSFVEMVCKQLGISDFSWHLSHRDKNRTLERYRFEEKKLFAFVSSDAKLLKDHHADLNIMVRNVEDEFCHDAEILITDVKDFSVVKNIANQLRIKGWLGLFILLILKVFMIMMIYFQILPIYLIPIIELISDIYFFFLIYSKKRA